jgi:hypothetical protein
MVQACEGHQRVVLRSIVIGTLLGPAIEILLSAFVADISLWVFGANSDIFMLTALGHLVVAMIVLTASVVVGYLVGRTAEQNEIRWAVWGGITFVIANAALAALMPPLTDPYQWINICTYLMIVPFSVLGGWFEQSLRRNWRGDISTREGGRVRIRTFPKIFVAVLSLLTVCTLYALAFHTHSALSLHDIRRALFDAVEFTIITAASVIVIAAAARHLSRS